MLKAQKVRLYPNKAQQQIISSQIGGARYVYNRALALRKFAYDKFGLKIAKFEIINHFTKLKKREKTSWLKDIDSQAIQQSIANMDKAYQHFFKGGGYPKFKSRHHSRQSYQYPQRVKIEANRVFLHKLSKQYSENQTVVVEDLKIKNMTKGTKGTVEKPSKNAKAKRGLNRVITQQS